MCPLDSTVEADVVLCCFVAVSAKRLHVYPSTRRVLELCALGALHKLPVDVREAAEALDVPRPALLAEVLPLLRRRRREAHAVHVLPHEAPLALHHGPLLVLLPADAPRRLLVDAGARTALPVLPPPVLPPTPPAGGGGGGGVLVPVLLFEAAACAGGGVAAVVVPLVGGVGVVGVEPPLLACTLGDGLVVGGFLGGVAFYELFGEYTLPCYELVGDEHRGWLLGGGGGGGGGGAGLSFPGCC